MTPPAFTRDQVLWLAAREAELEKRRQERENTRFRRFRNRATAGFLILLVGVGGSFYTQNKDAATSRDAIVQSGRVVSVDGCNRDYHSRVLLRGLLISARDAQKDALKDGQITERQYKTGKDYFKKQLAANPPLDCRPAATLITSDADELPPVPAPLYPKPPPKKVAR